MKSRIQALLLTILIPFLLYWQEPLVAETSVDSWSDPEIALTPVLYQGRFRPIDSAAKTWLKEWYGSEQISEEDRVQYKFHTRNPVEVWLKITLQPESYQEFIKKKEASPPPMQLFAGRNGSAEWLTIEQYGQSKYYTPELGKLIQKAKSEPSLENVSNLTVVLQNGYSTLENTLYQKGSVKSLAYPSKERIEAESFLMNTPLNIYAIVAYLLALLLRRFPIFSFLFLAVGFVVHTAILALRSYILMRPPVSNMFETVLYVPWITMVVGIVMSTVWGKPLIRQAATLSATLLLILLSVTGISRSLDNVQAVLDSQFWLSTHVLMVVGSYGIFLLAGILGHIYLLREGKDQSEARQLEKTIIQTLYLGIALLIPGTILGGVWAAESWGRFWDWDPKESWAFISSCAYLIIIHSYTFGKIRAFGLAVGSIIGLLFISFTWYGVNYVLGTGLHSYGFGSGGEVWYYAFLGLEMLFIAERTIRLRTRKDLNNL